LRGAVWRNKAGMHAAEIAFAGYIAVVAVVRISGNRTLSRMNAFDLIVSISVGSIFGLAIVTFERFRRLAEPVRLPARDR
jgi:hypothetical protein